MPHISNLRAATKFMLALSVLLFISALSSAADKTDVLPQYEYSPLENVDTRIDSLLAQALSENKLAMIVLGSSWCHDSVGLSKNFSSDAMHKILQDNYKTLFLDLGYLQDVRYITQRFGYPGYFGTPTVLVIEPNTLSLVNHDEVSKWQSANSVPFDEYVSYFSQLKTAEPMSNGEQTTTITNAQITQFEQTQIERLFRAYAILGPLLEADEKGELENTDVFYKQWSTVYNFRKQLQADLVSLKQQAHLNQQNNESSTELEIPEYPAFEWES
jgi:hypothetical protein